MSRLLVKARPPDHSANLTGELIAADEAGLARYLTAAEFAVGQPTLFDALDGGAGREEAA